MKTIQKWFCAGFALSLLIGSVFAATETSSSGDATNSAKKTVKVSIPDDKLSTQESRELLLLLTEQVMEQSSELANTKERFSQIEESQHVTDLALQGVGNRLDAIALSLQESSQALDQAFKKIAELQKTIERSTERTDSKISALEANDKQIQEAGDSLRSQLSDLEKRLEEFTKQLSEQSVHHDQQVSDVEATVHGVKESTEKQFNSVESVQAKYANAVVVAGVLMLAVFGFLGYWLARRQKRIKSAVSHSIAGIQEEQTKLDLRLSELLSAKLTTSTDTEVDHKLPLNVADEILRMRKRIERLPPETKAIRPLEQALERLEEVLAAKGYEIVKLIGHKYVEGLNVRPRFTTNDDLGPGEEVITNVFSPQVNYQGAIIQIADVEVSVGE